MKIIGIHNGHDACITAMENGKILGHWELERHFGIKHFEGVYYGNAIAEFLRCHVLPILSWHPYEIHFMSLSSFCASWIGDAYTDSEFYTCVLDKYDRSLGEPFKILNTFYRGKPDQKFFLSEHHVNHMAYSYYTSPFDEALLFAYDGQGDFRTTTTFGLGKNRNLQYLGNLTTHPRSDISDNRIGACFNRFGEVLRFFGDDWNAIPGKAMGYSSYGEVRDDWKKECKAAIFDNEERGNVFPLLENLGLPEDMDSRDQRAMDLMATFQSTCEDYILDVLKKLILETGQKNVCLSGGCALNVLINEKIRNEIAENLYVPPACSDTGQSLGSVLYLWHHVLKKPFFSSGWHNPYLGDFVFRGQRCDAQIIKDNFKNEAELIEEASDMLVDGKIIGWAHGRSEIGPRALGNRSILALPSDPKMKKKINDRIKHREWWRPFAPVCLFEDFQDWFDTKHESPYMLFSPMVKSDKKDLIPAVTHVDGSARLQTVHERQNPLLHKLLCKVKEKTSIPVLLNTSLNGKGKPIANSVDEICDLLKKSQLDCAFIGLEKLTATKFYL